MAGEFDPAARAVGHAASTEELLMVLCTQIARLADGLLPGMPGVQGAENTPEFQTRAEAVTTARRRIMGNARRVSLVLHNLGPDVAYVVADEADAAADGLPIPVGTEREIKVHNSVWIWSAGTSDIRRAEESS